MLESSPMHHELWNKGKLSMRRTKASLAYRRTKNLRAVQLLLGHTKLESTVRYLEIELMML
jgi:site-specific recombinase XerC